MGVFEKIVFRLDFGPFALKFHILSGLLFAILLVSSCKEKPDPPLPTVTYQNGIFFINEGNYLGGNASLDFLGRDSSSVQRDIFSSTHGRPLGDVAQSAYIHNGHIYVLINNSQHIKVLNLEGLAEDCEIRDLLSPRYMVAAGNSRAYVSDLYANAIHLVDLNSCKVIKSIATGGWTEAMHLRNGKLFVAQAGTDKLLVIDTSTDQLTDSIFVGREPVSIVEDLNGKLWILCSGGINETPARLLRFSPDSLALEASFVFPNIADSPSELAIDPGGNHLYWLKEGVFRMQTADVSLPQLPFISAGNRNLYGLGIDPGNGQIYVSNSLDFVQEGWVIRYEANGSLRDSMRSGVNCGAFVFVD